MKFLVATLTCFFALSGRADGVATTVALHSTANISGNELGFLKFGSGSNCTLQTNELPWKADCNYELSVHFDSKVVGGEIKFGGEVNFNMNLAQLQNATSLIGDFDLRFQTPSVDISLPFPLKDIDVKSYTIPETGTFRIPFDLTKLHNGICIRKDLKTMAEISQSLELIPLINAAVVASAAIGADICIEVPIFEFNPEERTGELQIHLILKLLSTEGSSGIVATLIKGARSVLGLDDGLEWRLNFGALLKAEMESENRRLLGTTESNSVDNAGTIKFSDSHDSNGASYVPSSPVPLLIALFLFSIH